jgi:Transposase, Mutator family
MTWLSKSQVSEMAKDLDGQVEAFRTRPLDAGPYTFVAADALVLKVRKGGRTVNVHALLAVWPPKGIAPCGLRGQRLKNPKEHHAIRRRRSRAQFPSLASGIAHFDGSGGTQAPAVVGAAIARTLTGPLSNRGLGVASEQNAEDAILAFRTALADLLGASPAGIVYGRSATQIAYDFSRHLARTWAPGDEVVVT